MRKRGYEIPLNKIHRYYRETGKSKPNPKRQKKRKRRRYERKYSGSLIHGDWHRSDESKPYAIVWMDDASRYVLHGAEFAEATAKHSIETHREAVKKAWLFRIRIKETNTDRGTQFYADRGGISRFQIYLNEQGIKHIVSRKNNPQTNGKLERFWLEYDRHRWRFDSIDEFISWYNHRIHGSLYLQIGENPSEAFLRNAHPESLLGLFFSISQNNNFRGENHAFK